MGEVPGPDLAPIAYHQVKLGAPAMAAKLKGKVTIPVVEGMMEMGVADSGP